MMILQQPCTIILFFAIRSNSTINQTCLRCCTEYNDLQSALDIATHWVEQEPKDVPALFYLSHIALKTHEYELAANLRQDFKY